MTVREVLARATEHLGRRGIESPRLDAELLLAKALGLSRIELYTEHDRPLTEAELAAARALVARRARREPLAYVLGEWGFRRLVLKTDPRALVPRPETEVLVERALALVAGLAAPRILDVGTGTGAIALALADEHPGARMTAMDVSEEALALARENAAKTGAAVELVHRDARLGLPPGPFDLVVSNPPYVREEELAGLEPEVTEWEPRVALLDVGLEPMIAVAALAVLNGGWLVLETHTDDTANFASIVEQLGYLDVRITRDLAGRERVVEGRAPAER